MLPPMNERERDREPRPTATAEWVHICECCGERMEERQCKIVCRRCGRCRDCSDP
jgi:hypothetical protein